MDTVKNTVKTVLAIEDERNIIRLIKRLLEKNGYRAIVVANGTEAMHYIADTSLEIDLIIFDLHLPDISGYSMFLKIKDHKPNSKVLLTSGLLDDVNLEQLCKQGAIHYLAKPYDNKTFLDAVTDCLVKKYD